MAPVSPNSVNPAALKAIVLGATGATGVHLVRLLALCEQVKLVSAVSRRPIDDPAKKFGLQQDQVDAKLKVLVVDFDSLESSRDDFAGYNLGFCCLGTTRRQAGSAENFRKVDLEYVTNAAKLMRDGGVKHFSLVTSKSANADSWFLYLKTKGESELCCKNLGFDRLSIFRPGMLQRGDESRFVERVGSLFLPASLSVSVDRLAEALVKNAVTPIESPAKCVIIEHADIRNLNVPQ